ncbi:MAG: LytTR family DNA-binding domain-containing protein [Bacteroidota bacterium]
MNILIIEDEENLARQLKRLLLALDDGIIISCITASVKESIDFLQTNSHIDLILADIYLNDGLSFEIFERISNPSPIIFCTAYDQYAIKAFELDSVDYLLKPIKREELKKAIDKYKRLFTRQSTVENLQASIHRLSEKLLKQKHYRKSFLLTNKDRLVPVSINEISHFQTKNGLVKCITIDQRMFAMELSLDAIMEELNPQQFYRANRQYLVNKDAIVDVEYYFNGRLFLNIRPKTGESIIISKAKATDFKNWMV